MIQLAIEYRQAEKNTPPDFSTNPPTPRNSVFCQKAPKNPELNGLVQAQDPANDPNIFFDPALGKSVTKGSQANTFPFGTNGNAGNDNAATPPPPAATDDAATGDDAAATPCETVVTVTVTATAEATAAPTQPAAVPNAGTDIGNFGSCSIPEIEFGVGFDGRRETSFQPADKQSFNHGSAQNIDIITQFICDTLTNSCGADQTAKDTCQRARAAASSGTAKTGVQADLFNAEFGIPTNFANVVSVDDKGAVVPGTGSAEQQEQTNGSVGVGNFGSCSVPEIEFGVGFDNRKETSFQPVDLQSYNHGSAQNIDIITQFICDTLTNKCNADATAKAVCQRARAAASSGTPKTGEQADLFNAVFGKTTNFAGVAAVDNQGNVVAGTGNGGNNAGAAPAAPATTTAAAAPPAQTAPAPAAGNLQKFTGALGGVVAPTVTQNGAEFQVEGNASFKELTNALRRSCDVQNNKCANAANASGNQNGFNVGACNAQQQQCLAQASA